MEMPPTPALSQSGEGMKDRIVNKASGILGKAYSLYWGNTFLLPPLFQPAT